MDRLLEHIQYIPFNSFSFIVFLSLCTLVYYAFAPKLRWMVLLAASVVFYIFAGIEKLPFILAVSVIIWLSSYMIDRTYEKAEAEASGKGLAGKEKALLMQRYKKQCRNRCLIPASVIVIGILCYCKFFERIAESVSALLSLQGIQADVIVPLGISYYTFSSLGYLLDVYWRKAKHEKNYFHFALCVFYFPQIVQGPIARYQKLMPQFFRENRFDFKRVCFGMQLMLYGYFKKMVIGDRIAIFTGQVLGNIDAYEGLVLPITLVLCSFQLYMDFSGCMDIVRGTSQIFGIELENNFNHPFFSKTTAEFWRRWHITLGAWFKDYVYLPIAASHWLINLTSKVKTRFGKKAARNISTIIPLMIVWLLTGLWHGTGWNYIVWGIYYGTIIVCGTLFSAEYKKLAGKLHIDMDSSGYRRFQMLRTFLVFTGGRLLSAPGSLQATRDVICQTFKSFNPWIFWDGTLYGMGIDYKDWCVIVLGLLFVWRVSIMQETCSVREYIAQKNIVVRWAVYYIAVFSIIILGIYGVGYNASDFIYANF